MTKLFSISVLLTLSLLAFGQDDPASRRTHAARTAITEPSYGLSKVKKLISKLKTDSDDNTSMPTKEFNSLTLHEKFTYVMLHGEEFSQNCSVMPPLEHEDTMIFAYAPDPFGDDMIWSERQTSFLNKNRAAVVAMIRATMKAHRHVGANLKEAIVQMTATELIPDLISAHQREPNDHDILTVLMLVMKEKKYKPFLVSTIFKKLYGADTSYQAHVPANATNEKLILNWATAFAKARTR